MTTIDTSYGSAYLTQSWLDAHQGASQALDSNPEFLTFLSENPDFAKSFTDSAQGAQEAVQAAVDAGAIQNEAMGRLLGQASLTQGTLDAQGEALLKDYNDYVTSDWLREHFGAAVMLNERPELAEFLNANPEYAQNFVDSPEGATKAVESLLAQQPDLGWQVSDLVPSGATIQSETDVGQSSGANGDGTDLEPDQGYV